MLRPVLVGNDVKLVAEGRQQFAGRQQEIWVARPAEMFVAAPEGLDDQGTAFGERCDQMGKMRPVKVIGDDNGIEYSRSKWPGTGLEVRSDNLDQGVSSKVDQSGSVEVHRRDSVAGARKGPRMAPMAGGDIQNLATRQDERRPAQDPRRRRNRRVGRAIKAWPRKCGRRYHRKHYNVKLIELVGV